MYIVHSMDIVQRKMPKIPGWYTMYYITTFVKIEFLIHSFINEE